MDGCRRGQAVAARGKPRLAVWALPIEGLDPKRRADSKAFLDQLWPILSDARRFERAVIKICQPQGN